MDFDFCTIGEKEKDKIEFVFRSNRQKVKALQIEKISDAFLPKKDECLDIITSKNLNFASFLILIPKEKIERCILATYFLSLKTIKFFIESEFKNLSLLINSNLARMHENVFNYLKDLNCEKKFNDNHSKFMLIETIDNNYYVLVGSGNLTTNAKIEQYCIRNNKELFNFYYDFYKEIKIK